MPEEADPSSTATSSVANAEKQSTTEMTSVDDIDNKSKEPGFASFFRLPLELRFRIYELADVIPPGPFAYGRSLPPIFHTSRQFYAETVELLKHRGDFHIYTPTAGYQWLRAPSCAQLRHVTVFIDTITTTATTTAAADASDYRWDLFVRDVLARLPGLRLRLRSASVEVDAAALWAMVREIPQCAENERTCVEEGNGHARALVIMPKGEGVVGEESRYVSDTMDMRTGGLARA